MPIKIIKGYNERFHMEKHLLFDCFAGNVTTSYYADLWDLLSFANVIISIQHYGRH